MIKRKKIAWIGGLTAVSVATASFCVVAEADRRWGAWATQTDALQERLQSADVHRPVLFGTATPGDAWKAYAAAVALAVGDEEMERRVRPSSRAKQDPSQLAGLIRAHGETLAQLHDGAHCEEARDPVDWSRGFAGATPTFLGMRGLSNLAVTHALAQIEDAQPVAAVETLLNAAQLGRDLMHSHLMINEMIGCALVIISTCEATGSNNLLERLSPAALARFAEGLAVLDEHIGRVGPSFHGEAVLFARTAENNPQLFEEIALAAGSWRYGFSTRLMYADTGLQILERADQVVAAAHEPWSVCRAHLSNSKERVLVAGNPMLTAITGVTGSVLITRFKTVARVRLLRMAIEHRRGEPIPGLNDPFGAHRRRATVRCW